MFLLTKRLFVLATVTYSVLSYVTSQHEHNSGRGLESGGQLHPRGVAKTYEDIERYCEDIARRCEKDANKKSPIFGARKRELQKCADQYTMCYYRGELEMENAKGNRGEGGSNAQKLEIDQCAICLEKFDDDPDKATTTLTCQHTFHHGCIATSFANAPKDAKRFKNDPYVGRCPLCKKLMTLPTDLSQDS